MRRKYPQAEVEYLALFLRLYQHLRILTYPESHYKWMLDQSDLELIIPQYYQISFRAYSSQQYLLDIVLIFEIHNLQWYQYQLELILLLTLKADSYFRKGK